MKKHSTTLALILLCFLLAEGQTKVKFGSVPIQDLEMKEYEKDPSAVAVVWYDKGYLNGNELEFKRHQRIKVLKKAGTEYANIELNVPTRGDFKAYVFNLENGEVVREKLTNSSIHEEELFNNFFIYKLFLPNVKVGSVIDLEYTFYGLPFEWRFQHIIPVVYSELILENSPYMEYQKFQKGLEPISKIRPGI